jgi:WD40 repeat protein
MDFSEVFKFSGLLEWSPDGAYIASTADYRLVIRDSDSLQIVQLYTCLEEVSSIAWSCDSKYVLTAMYKRGIVQVWSLEHPDWTCKIDEGRAGLSFARWMPDGRSLLTATEFSLRLTIWSLIQRTVSYIKFPKFGTEAGVAFTHNGKLMAVLERKDCKDYVSLFSTESWELVGHFLINTMDCAGMAFSPDDTVLACWDTCLEYRLLLYSLSGNEITSHRAYEVGLGIKQVKWSPCGQFLAVGSFDESVRLYNRLTGKVIDSWHHPTAITSSAVIVYKEVVSHPGDQAPANALPAHYVIEENEVNLPTVRVDPTSPHPKLGIAVLDWELDGNYLLSRNDRTPSTLFIWDIASLQLHSVLCQGEAIKCAVWNPGHSRLALCTGSSRIYLWSQDGGACVDVPIKNFKVHGISWSPDGTMLVLSDKNAFCCCFPPLQ